MFTIAVANLKGGCGKTTLATNLAAHYARQGMRTVLADADRQRCALAWASLRGEGLPPLEAVEVDRDDLRLPKRAAYVIVDAPAGLRKKEVDALASLADLLVVPVGPSAFDEAGTLRFLDALREAREVRKARTRVAFVANRVRPRSLAAARLDRFLAGLPWPAPACLSDGRAYGLAAATGRGLVDLPPGRVRRLLVEWAPLLAHVNDAITGVAR
ncbi:MAG: AAA family ATPase [Myxococcota bacterium]